MYTVANIAVKALFRQLEQRNVKFISTAVCSKAGVCYKMMLGVNMSSFAHSEWIL